MHAQGVAIAHGQWIDATIAYTTQLLATANEAWALSLRQYDSTGRWLMVTGRTLRGDSLRYASELTRAYHRDRGDLYWLLGAARLARHDTAGARDAWQRQWEEYARGDNRHGQYDVARRLLALALAQHDSTAAVRYAGDAFLAFDRGDGRIPPELVAVTAQLHALFKATRHDASPAGVTRFLDSLYRTDDIPYDGTPVTPYTGSYGGRTVLLSTETWVDCGGCRTRDDALDAMHARYQDNVFVLVHHYEVPFVTPGASGMGPTADGAWTVDHGILSVPYDRMARNAACGMIHVNGTCPTFYTADAMAFGAAPAPRLYDMVVPTVDSLLTLPALGAIRASVQYANGQIAVTAHLDSVAARSHPLKMHIVLVEDSLHFQGENHLRIWRMIPRRFAGDSATRFGFQVPSTRRGTFTTTFNLATIERELAQKNAWIDRKDGREPRSPLEQALRTAATHLDPAHLSVLVFVHDDVTGEVLHTVRIPLPIASSLQQASR